MALTSLPRSSGTPALTIIRRDRERDEPLSLSVSVVHLELREETPFYSESSSIWGRGIFLSFNSIVQGSFSKLLVHFHFCRPRLFFHLIDGAMKYIY